MNTFKFGFANINLLKNKKARRFLVVVLTISLMFSTVVVTFFRPGRVSADTTLLFDEGYGTSVNDSNGSVSAGTITGSVWRTDDLCRREKCLYFDGSGDKVTFSDDADLDFSATNTFTVSGWFRHPKISTNPDYLVTKHQSSVAGGYKIYMDTDGDISFGIDDDGTWGPEDVIGDDQGKNYDDNRWHHFTAVKDGTAGIYLYVDGVLIDQDTSLAASGSLANAASFYIGIDADGSSNSWDGFIDEVKVVRQVKSAAEVKAEYLGSTITFTGQPPVGYWKLDEPSANTCSGGANDSCDTTSSGSDGAWNGNATSATGKFGNAISLDGTGDYVSHAGIGDLAAETRGTYTMWVQTDTPTAADTAYSTTEGRDKGIAIALNDYYAGVYDGTSCRTINGGTPDTSWHHIAFSWDSALGDMFLYVDGALIASNYGASWTTGGTENGSEIGSPESSSACGLSTGDWDGMIDDVRVYDYVRTPAQILEDMSAAVPPSGVSASFGPDQSYLSNGLVGYWKMDESSWNGTAGEVKDLSGNNYNGTRQGNATTATGKYGFGGTFDGTGDGVALGDVANLSGASGITIASWFYTNSNIHETIISRSLTMAGSIRGYDLSTNFDGNFELTITTTGTGTSSRAVWDTGVSATNSTWQHVTATYNGITNTATLYINGIQRASSNSVTTGIMADGADNTNIGCWEDGCVTNFTNGNIDELRLYNRALSPVEVAKLSAWAPGPVVYYKFDEGVGTSSINDSSGNGFTGTMNGSMTNNNWVPGKYGTALDFDGVNDYVSANYNVGTAMSVSFWVNPDRVNNNQDTMFTWDQTYARSIMFYSSRWNFYDAGVIDIWPTTPTPTVGEWHFVSANFVSGGNAYLYIDGILVGSQTGIGTPTTSSLNIGGASVSSSYFDGRIDDLKVYNYPRTQVQIIEDMNGGHPAPGSPVGSALAHYKFDEGADNTCSGGSNDVCNSGNGGSALDGVASGMAIPGTSTSGWSNNGVFGRAMNFDGADDAVTLPVNSNFNLLTGGAISAWLYPRSSGEGAFGRVVDKSNDTNGTGGYTVEMDGSSTRVMVEINDVQCETTASSITQSAWNHFLWTFNGVNWNLYVNGKLNTTCAHTTLPSNTSLGVTIGNRQGATDRTFDGLIDELKIYSSPLSADQVKVEYNRGEAIVLGALSTDASGISSNSSDRAYCPPGDSSATCSPIGEWKLDENTGTSAFDISTVNNTGTLNGTSLWEPGKVGQALKFNGSSGYVSVPYSASQDPASNLSIGFWFKPTVTIDSGIASNKGLLSKANTSTDANNDWVFFWNSVDAGRMRFGTYGDNIQTTNATWTAGVWYHVEAVVTSTNTANIYINGKLDTYNADSDISTNPVNGNQNTVLNIGLAKVASGDLYCNCSIDDLRLYNYSRTSAQIAWDFNRGAPVGWWKMDESSWGGTAGEVKDASGNANHGVRVGNATTTSGKYNNAGTFDDNGDYVTVANSTPLEVTGDLSIDAWVKRNSTTAEDTIVDMAVDGETEATNHLYHLYFDSSGVIHLIWEYGAGSNETTQSSKAVSTPIDTWSHIAVTRNVSTNEVKFYENGVQMGTTQSFTNDPTGGTTATFVIGAAGSTLGDWPFDGLLDDVRLYNYVQTPQQIRSTMNQGAVRFNQ